MALSPFRVLGLFAEGSHLLAYGLQHYAQLAIPAPWNFWVNELVIVPMVTFGIWTALPVSCWILGHGCVSMGQFLLWAGQLPLLINFLASKVRVRIGDALEWVAGKIDVGLKYLIRYFRSENTGE